MSSNSPVKFNGLDIAVGRIGFGTMMMSFLGGKEEDHFTAIKTAIDSGSNLLNSATFYGPFTDPYGGLKLLSRFFAAHPDYAEKTVLMVKGGFKMTEGVPRGEIDYLRKDVLAALEALDGKKSIDIFLPARIPDDVSLSQLISNLQSLQREGHYKAIGLSEINAQTLRTAHAQNPISAVEIELSLMFLEPAALDVVKVCDELNIVCVSYSPLGRGLLTGKWKKMEDLDSPIAKMQPRFADGNFQENIKLVEEIEGLAGRLGCTSSQFALAYLLRLSEKIVPIPGSRNPGRIAANIDAARVVIPDAEFGEIQEFLKTFKPAGARYPEAHQKFLMK